MGYDLPAALGAAISRPGERIVCLAGDGSVQMNIQELQTVAHYQLPITLFVLNNGGYVSMRQTQDSFFGGRYVGSSESSGMSCPDFFQIARAYGLPAMRIEGSDFSDALTHALAQPAPLVVEVMLDQNHTFHPKLSSVRLPDGRMISKPLEDLSPLLPRDEFFANMLVPAWPED
jgi:acetolactate synthase-1/2/3 large subunit